MYLYARIALTHVRFPIINLANMPYSIDNKLVIAVSSSALFDMRYSHQIFLERGEEAYRQYQREHLNLPFEPGVAFPFIRRLLKLNCAFPEEHPIEVILFSKNSAETGLRAFRSIRHYELDITRACFTSGQRNYHYLPAFNAALFLSANIDDVREAVRDGYAAGVVLNQQIKDTDDSPEFRLGFDFDGVIADDSAERIYKDRGLNVYHEHELQYANLPISTGPIANLLERISSFQRLEREKAKRDTAYRRILKTSIITARNAPAHERVVTTLLNQNIEVDEVFFMGGIDKSSILNILKPHIFFDDQRVHLDHLNGIPAVHIPFGVANQ